MSTAEIKQELHTYINDADDRLLFLIYGLMLADKQSHETPDWHQKIIEERLEDYVRNPKDVISREELKSKIEKMK